MNRTAAPPRPASRDEERTEALREAYRTHPLDADSVLRRLFRQGRRPPFTEADFALDPAAGVTDQNHIGGAPAVTALAEAVRVAPESRVLDLGSGLGGPARWLADRYGCRVTGIDLSPHRHRDAMRLTALAGLEQRVRFLCGDFRRMRPNGMRFDVVWGQAAWTHVRDKTAHFERVRAWLASGGRVAFEDAYRRRLPGGRAARDALERLSERWHAEVSTRDAWLLACESGGLRVIGLEDLTDSMHEHYGRELAWLESEGGRRARSERRSVELARRLVADGVLGHQRLVAEVRPGRGSPAGAKRG